MLTCNLPPHLSCIFMKCLMRFSLKRSARVFVLMGLTRLSSIRVTSFGSTAERRRTTAGHNSTGSRGSSLTTPVCQSKLVAVSDSTAYFPFSFTVPLAFLAVLAGVLLPVMWHVRFGFVGPINHKPPGPGNQQIWALIHLICLDVATSLLLYTCYGFGRGEVADSSGPLDHRTCI